LLVGAVGVELLTLLAFLYVPGLSDVLGNGPITGVLWLPVAITPFLLLAAEEGRKLWVRGRRDRSDGYPAVPERSASRRYTNQ
jgi:hypothetical protein